MKHTCKTLLALLLVLALMAGIAPAVFADEPDATIAANAEKDLRYLALDDENNGPNDLYYQQKIMNPVVGDFVLWYSGKNTGYPIAWTSSDPSIIAVNDYTHMAELVRVPDEDATVTLTATMSVPYQRNSQDTYPMTKELTVRVPSLATRASLDCEALTILDPENVRENLPLVRKGKYGSDISWTSSDPAVVTDESESALYDGGVVARPAYGEAPATATLTATVVGGGKTYVKTFDLTVTPKPAPTAAQDHYLFVCYAENYDWNQDNLTTEEIYFGLSADGMNWQNINVVTVNGRQYTQPILRSTVGDMGTRDPHIVRSPDGDKFYVLATDLHAVGNPVPEREGAEFRRSSFDCVNGNRDLVIWETDDLTDWGEPRLVKCNFPSAGNTYAPEAVWDESKQAYLVYWASKDNAELNPDGSYKANKVGKIYYCYTRDFNTFSEPTLWLASTDAAMKKAFPSVSGEYDVYDTTIRYDPYDGLYYRFGTKNRLYVQTSTSLDGPWSDAIALPGTMNNSNIEAPTTYQLPDGTWMLLGDNYRQYVPYQAEHLADFVAGNYTAKSFQYASNGPRYKHGTILPITEEEYLALMTAFDNSLAEQEAPAPGEGFALDFRAGTITIAEGYEVRADSPTGPALESGSVTPWIGRTLYVRKPAAEGRKASAWTATAVEGCPHDYQAAVTAPTCTETGYTTFTCAICGDSYVGDEVAALDHDYNAVVTPPTCTEAGCTTFTCARCGNVLRDAPTDALGHDFADGVCTRCGAKDPDYVPPAPFRFDDVKDSNQYYYEPVYWAVEQGITNGTSKTEFSPEKGCTRAQVVTFLWRAAGKPKPTAATCAFKDVKEDAYYYDAVLWAVEKKITNGTSANTFDPEKTCTRAQIVTFLWRAAGEPAPFNDHNPFTDVKNGQYYYSAVLWAVERGVTKGTVVDMFSPESTCTRAQIVTFLYRTEQEPHPYAWLGLQDMPKCNYLDILSTARYYQVYDTYGQGGKVEVREANDGIDSYQYSEGVTSLTVNGMVYAFNEDTKVYLQYDMTDSADEARANMEYVIANGINMSGLSFYGTGRSAVPLYAAAGVCDYYEYMFIDPDAGTRTQRFYMKDGDVIAIYYLIKMDGTVLEATEVIRSITADIPAGTFRIPDLTGYTMIE